jgi:hypothetical protein
MNTKRKTYDIRTGRTFISRHTLHQQWYTCPIDLPASSKPAAQKIWLLSQPLPQLPFNLFVIIKMFSSKVFSDGLNSPCCKADVQEVPTAVLKFSPRLLGLYGVWHYHAEAVPLLPVGLDVSCELHPEASIELRSAIQNSYFIHASENGPTVLPESPKMW